MEPTTDLQRLKNMIANLKEYNILKDQASRMGFGPDILKTYASDIWWQEKYIRDFLVVHPELEEIYNAEK
jgi:hypothetical protein